MKVKITHAGMWGSSENIYEIDDDEILALLKRALVEIREDQMIGARLDRLDKLNEAPKP
jgi:hypothetical protein